MIGAGIFGARQILKALDKAGKELEGALDAAIYQEGFAIMGVSVRRVPVDKGFLRKSHYVAPPRKVMGESTVDLGYGVDYAPAVHDRVEVFHKVGGPLYLKSAMDEATAGYESRLARRAKENYEKGIRPGKVASKMPTKPKYTGNPGGRK